MIGVQDKELHISQDPTYPIGFYLIAKDMCATLLDMPIYTELHAVLSCGLGLPWRLGPLTVLWVLGVTPPHYLGELSSPRNIAYARY
jgi:hypothetical protein